MTDDIQKRCLELRKAYEEGLLGNQAMPEDVHPASMSVEERLGYFTLPMSLNYQRNSYTLWEAAKQAYEDEETRPIFSINEVSALGPDDLRPLLMKYKVALQPNKHIDTWYRISSTISHEWGSIDHMLSSLDYDFLKIQHAVQATHKKGFPYLSGPKIFHYWSYILGEYCGIVLKNRDYIQIAPDTHVIKCSIKLGVLTEEEALRMSRDEISERWRQVLNGTGLSPIDMHSPLWFWSKNTFSYVLKE